MKYRTVIIIFTATALIGGSAYVLITLFPGTAVSEPNIAIQPEPRTQPPPKEKNPPTTVVSDQHRNTPANTAQTAVNIPPPASHKPRTVSKRNQREAEIWRRHSTRFNQLLKQLENEQDPARRKNLIRSLAAFVRVDTLSAIEWAKGLEDPEEQRMALEDINKYALSGIGAKLSVDDSGYPRIAETTVLSAIASTGQVVPGDYIIGVIDAKGETLSFKNLPIQDVVRQLRGQPGSEVQLLIKRNPDGTNGNGASFTVPVQRSMIVIVPPY